MKNSQNNGKFASVLFKLGWKKNTLTGYTSTPFQLTEHNHIWHAGYCYLKRHRYVGVTADSAIRYRTDEGLRIQLTQLVDKPSRLLITTLATSTWMRWLLHHGLKLRGFKRYPQQFGTLQLYHQDRSLADYLSQHEGFNKLNQSITNLPGMLRWELSLIPGKLTLNFTLSEAPDMEHFATIFAWSKQITAIIEKATYSKELSLTAAEAEQLSNPEGQLKNSQIIKGEMIVVGVLLIVTAVLMGSLFGIGWLLS